MEWTTGVEHWTGLLECHAHKLVVYLSMRIILSHSKDCTDKMYEPRIMSSLAGQPLHKRGRVWSTSHHEFVLQSQQWASSTSSNSMLFAVSRDAVLAGLFGARHTEYACTRLVCVHSTRTSYYTSMRGICG